MGIVTDEIVFLYATLGIKKRLVGVIMLPGNSVKLKAQIYQKYEVK